MATRRLYYLLPLAVFGLMAAHFAIGLTKDPSILPSALIDKPVPEFALPPIEGTAGKGLSSADFRGGVSVLNVFASWCLPCRAEHPVIGRLTEMNIARVYGLNYKDRPADAKRWLEELGDFYAAIGADQSGRVGIDWGVYGVPETFVVDATGTIRYKHVGPIDDKILDKVIVPMIREAAR